MVPFHNWDCLSFQLSHREVDVVIKDRHQMDRLLKFLIHNLRTLDGEKGTANDLLNLMNK